MVEGARSAADPFRVRSRTPSGAQADSLIAAAETVLCCDKDFCLIASWARDYRTRCVGRSNPLDRTDRAAPTRFRARQWRSRPQPSLATGLRGQRTQAGPHSGVLPAALGKRSAHLRLQRWPSPPARILILMKTTVRAVGAVAAVAVTLPIHVLPILCGGMVVLVLLVYIGIALPAVWSAKPGRREAAAAVLRQILSACSGGEHG